MRLTIPKNTERFPGFIQRLRRELPAGSISILLEGLRSRKRILYGVDRRYLVVSHDMTQYELFIAGCRLRQAMKAATLYGLIRALEFWAGEV